MNCDHKPYDLENPDLGTFIDCQDKVYLVCIHCAALWNGEDWL